MNTHSLMLPCHEMASKEMHAVADIAALIFRKIGISRVTAL